MIINNYIKDFNNDKLKNLIKNTNVSICYFNENISKRPQIFTAKIISIKGKNENKSIKIMRKFNNDIIIQTFLLDSPSIIFIKKIL